MFCHYSMEGRRGLRWWLHFGGDVKRRCLGVELAWLTTWCHAEIRVDDDGWTWALGFPPFAIWISFDGFPAWKPMQKCIASWDNNREFWITDQRECGVSLFDWTIRIKPWVRGISFDLRRLLGKQQYTEETLREGIPVVIQMPEGMYNGIAKVQRQTWKRPLWFRQTQVSTWIDVPKGIPFAGKGENSWDCNDDGLFGCGVDGESVERAITHFREQVERSRKKYGRPSNDSVREALA